EFIRAWPAHGSARNHQLHQAGHWLQSNFCANAIEWCARVDAHAIFTAAIGNSGYARNRFCGDNAGAATDIVSDVTHDDRALGKASQDDLGLWTFAVHPRQLPFELGATLVAGVVVAHFSLRLHARGLRGLWQGRHTRLGSTT